MKSKIRSAVNSLLYRFNLKLTTAHRGYIRGESLSHDLPLLINNPSPTCLDVGANTGQTIDLLKGILSKPIIYALEPSSSTFQTLANNHRASENVHLFQLGAGNENGELSINKLSTSELNSFLSPAYFPWINDDKAYEIESEKVKVTTLDDFIEKNSIAEIDLLKSDTQGYDLNVLRGAESALRGGKVKHVLVEANFFEMYVDQGHFTDIYRYLEKHDFHLIDLYEKVRNPVHNATVSWCTALFGRRDNTNNSAVLAKY